MAVAGFEQTHWSVVHAAGRRDSADNRAALEKLCTAYWPPIYAYLRRRGYRPADAEESSAIAISASKTCGD
jgi:hypothetical protein